MKLKEGSNVARREYRFRKANTLIAVEKRRVADKQWNGREDIFQWRVVLTQNLHFVHEFKFVVSAYSLSEVFHKLRLEIAFKDNPKARAVHRKFIENRRK